MAEVRTFKIDDYYGVPDKMIRAFLTECEKKLGKIKVTSQITVTQSATLITVFVVREEFTNGIDS